MLTNFFDRLYGVFKDLVNDEYVEPSYAQTEEGKDLEQVETKHENEHHGIVDKAKGAYNAVKKFGEDHPYVVNMAVGAAMQYSRNHPELKHQFIEKLKHEFIKRDPEQSNVVSQYAFDSAVSMACGASISLSDKEKSTVHTLFGANGHVRYHDFIHGLKELYGKTQVEFRTLMKELTALAKHARIQGIDYEAHFTRYDSNDSGIISEVQFRSALGQLGVEFSDDQLKSVVASYQSDNSGRSPIMYRLFLNDLGNKDGHDSWKGEIVSVAKKTNEEIHGDYGQDKDITEKLNIFARKRIQKNPNGLHDLWVQLEHHDTRLQGSINIDSFAAAFKKMGLDLSNIEKRRLEARYSVEGQQGRIRYRDLLTTMLSEVQDVHIGVPQVVNDKEETGTSVLEKLTKSELEETLNALIERSKEEPFQVIDMRDVFEQHDFQLTGLIDRDIFMQCMSSLGFVDSTKKDDIKGKLLISRVANYFERENQIDYRRIFLSMADLIRRHAYGADKIGVQRNERDLMGLVAKVKNNVKHFALSGLNFEDCFLAMDENGDGTLTHVEFHKGLTALGIDVSVIMLPRLLKRFETGNAAEIGIGASFQHEKDKNELELRVRYKDFVSLVHYSMEEDAVKQGDGGDIPVPGGGGDVYLTPQKVFQCDSVHLNDRFEIIKLLRSHLCHAVEANGKHISVIKRCFDDLDTCRDGVLQVGDLMTGVKLLGIPATEQEIKRVLTFPYLFRNPGQHGGPRREPREPAQLAAQEVTQQKMHHHFEMTFEAFKEIMGVNAGMDNELNFIQEELAVPESKIPDSSRTENEKESERVLTFKSLLSGTEETHLSNDEVMQRLYYIYQRYQETQNTTENDCYAAFEVYDTDFSDLVDEFEARDALKLCMGLDLSEAEAHRLFRRLDLLVIPQKQQANAVEDSDEKLQQPKRIAGAARVKYRKLLREMLACANESDMDKLPDHHHWGTEMLLEHMRNHKKAGQLVESIKSAMISHVPSRKTAWGILQYFKDHHNSKLLGRLITKFEDTDGSINFDRLLRKLHLDIDQRKLLLLHRRLDCHRPDFQGILKGFELHDSNFTGTVTREHFKNCLREVNRFVDLTDVEMERLCDRFGVASAIGLKTRVSAVDYRSLFRYFSLSKPRNNENREEENPEHQESADADIDEETGLSARKPHGTFWKYLWNEGTDALENKVAKMTFFTWRIKKDIYEKAVEMLNKLHERIGQHHKTWFKVGVSLAATTMLIKALCPDGKIPSLENAFIQWTKRTHCFDHDVVQDGVKITVKLGFNFDDPKCKENKIFVKKSKTYWRQCERRVKSTLIVSQVKARKQAKLESRDEREEREERDSGEKQKGHKQMLMQMGLMMLQEIFEKDKASAEKAKEEQEKEQKLLRESKHKYFVEKKNELRVKLPENTDLKNTSLDMQLLMQRKSNSQKFCHVANFRELEKARLAILQSGFIFQANFKDDNGDVQKDEFYKIVQLKSQALSQSSTLRQQGADHQFDLWCQRKQARGQALKLLHFIDSPATHPGSDKDRITLWNDVGRALKAVDPTSLFTAFLQWSKGFASHQKCSKTWNQFSPKTLSCVDAMSFVWSHLRGVLVKILSKKKVNFASGFKLYWEQTVPKSYSNRQKEAYFKQVLRCLPAEGFRKYLHQIGIVNLRLNEEKRLFEFFPGVDERGDPVVDSVCMETFLDITGSKHVALSPEYALGWQSTSTGVTPEGHKYELALEERLHYALRIAGAPGEVCISMHKQKAGLQRGLIFLNVVSRANRLRAKKMRQKQAQVKPPTKPVLLNDSEKSDPFSLHLQWSIQDDSILFFSLEQIRSNGVTTHFETVFKDPPTLTTPATPKKGIFTVPNLKPDTKYTFRLIAFNEHGPSVPCRNTFSTKPEQPPIPRLVAIRCAGRSARCTLAWNTASKDPGEVKETCKSQAPLAVLPESMRAPGTNLRTPTRAGATSEGKLKSTFHRKRERHFELLVSRRARGIDGKDVGVVIYKGQDTRCDVIGLKPGCAYEFCVRALNTFGEPGEVTPVCSITPLLPPVKPRVSCTNGTVESAMVSWGQYDGSGISKTEHVLDDTEITHGVLSDWAETLRKWKGHKNGSYRIKYLVQISQDKKIVHADTTTKLSLQVGNLSANSTYRVKLRMICTVIQDSEECVHRSPWSPAVEFTTPPNPPTQAVLVSASASDMILRWYAPLLGASLYKLELRTGISMDGQEKKQSELSEWKPVYKGSAPFATIPGLTPNTVYMVRAIAMNSEGTLLSKPSLPSQFRTLSMAESSACLPAPSRARLDFTIPCASRDLVLGDLILFTEHGDLPCYRTIAGRLVVHQTERDLYWFQVEWCTLSSKKHKSSLQLLKGSRIQRKVQEVFQLEAEVGVYRMAWAEEDSRWSKHEEKVKPTM